MTNFAEKLREARQKKGWNQDDLAREVGLSQGAISQFEKGLRIPTPANIARFSLILEVSQDYLVGEEELTNERVRLMRSIQSLSKDNLKKVEDYVNLVKKAESPDNKGKRK